MSLLGHFRAILSILTEHFMTEKKAFMASAKCAKVRTANYEPIQQYFKLRCGIRRKQVSKMGHLHLCSDTIIHKKVLENNYLRLSNYKRFPAIKPFQY